MNELRLVYGCPKWCTEDHAGVPLEDLAHESDAWELRLPDGRLMMDARVSLEPGETLPRLVVAGQGIDAFMDDVAVLDAEQASQFANALQSFTQRVQHTLRTLEGKPSGTPAGKKPNPGQRARAAWRETRLYLAERDGRRCFYCRTEFDKLKGVTIDHYVPKSVWPCNLPANLVLSCPGCNHAKGDRLTWSMAAVLLAWQTVTVTVTRDGHAPGTPGREAPAAGETPLPEPAVAACS